MRTITEKAKEKIMQSASLRGALMEAFDKREKTIQNWVEDDNIILTTPLAVEIISRKTGLHASEILQPFKNKIFNP